MLHWRLAVVTMAAFCADDRRCMAMMRVNYCSGLTESLHQPAIAGISGRRSSAV